MTDLYFATWNQFDMHEQVIKRLILTLPVFCMIAASAMSAEEVDRPSPALDVPAAAVHVTDPAAATRAWLDTVPADKRAKSDAYFEGGYWLILWNFLLAAAISIFLLSSRISARLRDFAERTTQAKTLQVVLYVIPYFLLTAVLSFPLTVYQQFYREHQYGLATQTFGPWFGEQLIALVVSLIGGTLLLIGLYAVFRRAPRAWWLWGTIVVVIFSFIRKFYRARLHRTSLQHLQTVGRSKN